MNRKPRWLLMGTPQLAADVFKTFLDEGHHVIGLVCQPDKKMGRDQRVEKPPTKILAETYGIPVYQPVKIRLDPGEILSLDVDYILTLAYGQIVPQRVLDVPKFGAYNLHGSLLPLLRGASPLRYCLIENHTVTGVTLMKMILDMDAGDMLAQSSFAIEPTMNYTQLVERFTNVTQAFVQSVIPSLVKGTLNPIAQDPKLVTFAPLLKKEQEHLPLSAPASTFLGWVRALSEEPGGYLILQGKHIKLLDVTLEASTVKEPLGTILAVEKDGILFQGSDSVYRIHRLHIEGKPKRPLSELAQGYRHWVGQRFE